MSDIFERITSAENLFAAWREFRRGKRRRADVQMFERYLEENIFRLRDDLVSDRYRHGPYQRFRIRDPKPRTIHKAAVRDRLVHQAVVRVLAPALERSYILDSASCQRGKGPHAAVRRLEAFRRRVSRNGTCPCWALKFDIAKFFDSVDHRILLGLLAARIPCPKTFRLVAEIVGSYSVARALGGGVASQESERPRGLPLGSVTSQLFANTYLDAFDHYSKECLRLRCYLRYTDDIVVLDRDPAVLLALLPLLTQWLWEHRRLTVHPRKIVLRKLSQGIDFLGYVVLPRHTVLRTRTKRRMFRRFNAQNVTSYLGLLRHCAGWRLRTRLAAASRHRLE
ncbi:MAG: hypothetical protein G01um101438_1050 [Parcubacteria group bacterium Gr01-1014_38]|nr:MAG: hypothetical protein G01um101438_1050 [Parcubacteria group bacterium Gr01-1014_38]